MRLQEILNENLEWGNGQDKDVYMSLKGLVNKNDGVFKSQKQQWFVTNKIVKNEDRSPADALRWFGVRLEDDQKLVYVDAIARWANYGSRSQIPVRYGFVMDDIGVAAFYRIGNKGNLADGASPDPSKTKLEWERPANVDASHLEKSEEEKKKEFKAKLGMSEGNYLGTEGERMNFGEVELVTKKYMGDSQFGYNQSTPKYWNMYKDVDGNIIYHTGKEGPEKGQKVILAATVKKHLVSKKGDKVTVVIRPRFKVIENMKINEIEGHKLTIGDKVSFQPQGIYPFTYGTRNTGIGDRRVSTQFPKDNVVTGIIVSKEFDGHVDVKIDKPVRGTLNGKRRMIDVIPVPVRQLKGL